MSTPGDHTTRWPQYLAGTTTHARRGGIQNVFRYGVDYVLLDPNSTRGPLLFSRNRWNLASVMDRNHGGAPKQGRGLTWAKEVFEGAGLAPDDLTILLLTQPSFLGYIFNPVSFWLAYDGDDLRAVIAEVSNTFGDRHSYLCAQPGFAPITAKTCLTAQKIFHVSPFQEVAGAYRFTFDITKSRIAIRIAHENGAEGVIATLVGDVHDLNNARLIKASLRRPLGAMRTVALIYWQALKLKLKGARYRRRPLPPEQEVS
ncbi:MAG: DUF1365 domain-containing protein [Tritonibacter mobilis]|nr:conserved hypothetical protein [Ruegeria sp. TrichCH4B]MCK5500440.1 DUF1365 domain-containing protein [Tritonibacter mobilis]